MGKGRSNTWSKVLLTLGAIGLFMTGILGWLNAAVVNGENFAGLVNEIRQDEAVKTEIGQASPFFFFITPSLTYSYTSP